MNILAKRSLFVVYLILFHAFVVVVFLETDVVDRIQQRLGFEIIHDELTPHYHVMLNYHKSIDKHAQKGSVIFIGDSMIQGMSVSSVHPRAVNYGIGYDTSYGVIKRLPDYLSVSQAGLVVIAIGYNDLKRRNLNELVENYHEIIHLIPYHVPVLFSAILPVDEEASGNTGFNARILDINNQIFKMCESDNRLYILDVSYDLKDKDGGLSDKYHIGDGVHLNQSGYMLWISKLKNAIELILL